MACSPQAAERPWSHLSARRRQRHTQPCDQPRIPDQHHTPNLSVAQPTARMRNRPGRHVDTHVSRPHCCIVSLPARGAGLAGRYILESLPPCWRVTSDKDRAGTNHVKLCHPHACRLQPSRLKGIAHGQGYTAACLWSVHNCHACWPCPTDRATKCPCTHTTVGTLLKVYDDD